MIGPYEPAPPPGTLLTSARHESVRWLTLDELGRAGCEEVAQHVPVVIVNVIVKADGSNEDEVHVLLPSGRLGHRHWGALTTLSIGVL